MPSLKTSLATLVQSIDVASRDNPRRCTELIEGCETILNSHIGENKDADVGSIAASVKRQLLQQPGGSNTTLRFSNLLARLLEQPILTRKHSVLLFLQALALPPPPSSTPSIAAFIPSLAPPPTVNGRASPLPSPLEGAPSSRVIPSSLTVVPTQPHPKPKTKAELLKEWRAQNGKPHLPERLLLRDTLYLIQGISGKYVRFSNNPSSPGSPESKIVFVDDPEYIVSAPTQALVHKLSEIGHLYSRVAQFVKERTVASSIGMIEQSLCHHLQAQLTEYYKLVAILESQMTHKEEEDRMEDSGLTLRRLDVWIDDWRLRMRMMSVCVENCRGAKGGALVSLIHGNTNNGDSFVRGFTDQLLEEVSKPFFSTLLRWITTGELHDPYEEFFVAAHPDLVGLTYVHPTVLSADEGFGRAPLGAVGKKANGEEVGSLKLWESKFVFRREMLPSFLSEEFGRKIFSTGKSLNFIRYSCQDGEWVAAQSKSAKAGTLKYSDISGLEQSIDAAYRAASQRIYEIFFQRYKFMDHLLAIKSYLMLGYGDFVDQLMESLGSSLDHPANTLFRHNLTATLETAIRYTSASQDSTDVLRRLDARILDYQHGERGWDVFTLEYKVDAPIDTVLGEESMIQYARLFNHLWKMKRVEEALVHSWSQAVGGARSYLKVPELEQDWHQARIVMAGMNHFIRQLTSYSHMEVIAVRWKALVDFLHKKEGDLDALIDAHQTYLDMVVRKVLLLHPKSAKEENLLAQVREAFATILQFQESITSFYKHTLAESAVRDAQKDVQRGVVTTFRRPSNSLSSPSLSSLPQLGSASPAPLELTLQRLREYGTAFSERVATIVSALGNHPDQDCRFLAVKLSFGDFYRVKAKEKAEREAQQNQQAVVPIGGKEVIIPRPSQASTL